MLWRVRGRHICPTNAFRWLCCATARGERSWDEEDSVLLVCAVLGVEKGRCGAQAAACARFGGRRWQRGTVRAGDLLGSGGGARAHAAGRDSMKRVQLSGSSHFGSDRAEPE